MKQQTVCPQHFLKESSATGFVDSESQVQQAPVRSDGRQVWSSLPTTWKVLPCYLAGSDANWCWKHSENMPCFMFNPWSLPRVLTWCISSKPMLRLIGLAMLLSWSWNLFQGIPLHLAGTSMPNRPHTKHSPRLNGLKRQWKVVSSGFKWFQPVFMKGRTVLFANLLKRERPKLNKHPSP